MEDKLCFKYGDMILENNKERKVTSIMVDNFKHTISFIIEIGLKIDAVEITIDAAQESGLLNLDKLNNFYK